MQHATEFIFSLLTFVSTIIAIVMFIYYGSSLAFYVAIIVAIAIGFINAWLISKSGAEVAAKPTAPKANKAKATRSRSRR